MDLIVGLDYSRHDHSQTKSGHLAALESLQKASVEPKTK